MKMEAKAVELMTMEKSVLPPPPPPLPRVWAWTRSTGESITNQEIAKFWRKKRIEEEEHLLAAIKAAARIRARNFSEGDYKLFIAYLEDEDADPKEKTVNTTASEDCQYHGAEVRIGIKDWWTKSNYAYLNQPAIGSVDCPWNRSSSYTPNCFAYKPTPLYSTSLGVF